MIYLLDTNAVTDLSRNHREVTLNRNLRLQQRHQIALCPPVYYESLRGLLKVKATAQIARLRNQFIPLCDWFSVTDEDWLQAAQFWADVENKGRKLSDIDLLIAAIAHRIGAVIVSADADFDALSVQRNDWRLPPPT